MSPLVIIKFLNTEYYASSGTYYQHYFNVHNCDSIIVLHLTIKEVKYTSINNLQSCGPYWIGGQALTTPGFYNFAFPGVNGCDSVISFYLTINQPQIFNRTASACQRYYFNGQWLTQSGKYKEVYTGSNGCDSAIALDLKILGPDSSITQSGPYFQSATSPPATYQWINCDLQQPIPGATQQTFFATQNGHYAVVVSKNGCVDTSACRMFYGLGAQPVHRVGSFYLFPNPTQDLVTISWGEEQACTSINIVTMAGQLMYDVACVDGLSHRIDVSTWASGVYLVTLEQAGRRSVFKFTKL